MSVQLTQFSVGPVAPPFDPRIEVMFTAYRSPIAWDPVASYYLNVLYASSYLVHEPSCVSPTGYGSTEYLMISGS